MAFTSLNGIVDVTLPASVKANVKLRSDQGDVFTDFDIQLTPGQGSAGGQGHPAEQRPLPDRGRSVALRHDQRRRAGIRAPQLQRQRLPARGGK